MVGTARSSKHSLLKRHEASHSLCSTLLPLHDYACQSFRYAVEGPDKGAIEGHPEGPNIVLREELMDVSVGAGFAD